MSSGETSSVRLFGGEVTLLMLLMGRETNLCSVSALKNIKRACSSSIDKYDSCLAKNKSNPLNCIDILREVSRRNE